MDKQRSGAKARIPDPIGARLDGELPLDQYAAIGDGRSVAMIGADGSIDWWCVPHMDSTPFFDRLLDPWEGGRFSVTLLERSRSPEPTAPTAMFWSKPLPPPRAGPG